MNKKTIRDWVSPYDYFDFTDAKGIRSISHQLLHDLIEKCIELEERVENFEGGVRVSAYPTIEEQATEVNVDEKPKFKDEPFSRKERLKEIKQDVAIVKPKEKTKAIKRVVKKTPVKKRIAS